ncbi:MAG TPA: hypothetical protein VH088_11795 [Terriglobales bacterium]|nr:hypothetical protein [Terriglobales bacterium]
MFSTGRERLLNQDLAQKFSGRVKEQATGQISDKHFSVDGTLIEAWVRQRGLAGTEMTRPWVEEIPTANRAVNRAHGSRTSRKARLYKKSSGQKTKLTTWGIPWWRSGTV